MFRFTAIFPILLSIAAFALSILVLLAGKDTSFLNDVFVLKIDTSQIATDIDPSAVLRSAGIDPNNTGISQLDDIIASLSADDLGRQLNTAAHELGLHDFYSAHVSTWCEGTLLSDNATTATNSSDVEQRVTVCTRPAYPFSFNPIAILESELLQGLTLEQVGFPTADVDRVVSALEAAYKAMSICYLVGTILAGVSIVTGLVAFRPSRLLEAVNHLVALLAFVLLGVGSAIATTIAIRVKDVFNQRAAAVNVSATHSVRFLGMTWAAVVCMLLVSLLWCCVCCCGGHSRKESWRDSQVPMVEEKQPRPSRFPRFGRGAKA